MAVYRHSTGHFWESCVPFLSRMEGGGGGAADVEIMVPSAEYPERFSMKLEVNKK